MLREVKNKHIKPRIVPFEVTTTASTATVDIGYGDYTATRTGTGAATLTHRQGFSRSGLIFLSNSQAASYYACYNSATNTSSAFPVAIFTDAGVAAEGNASGFCFGWDSSDLSISKAQRVAATQDAPRIIWGKITGSSGAVTIGSSDFSCTRTGTGAYTITFKKAFGKPPCVKVTCSSSGPHRREFISAVTAAGCTVATGNSVPAAADSDFYICAIGTDGRSDSARGRLPLENSQRKPRIVAGQVTMASGTPSISIGRATGGADLITLVDNGAGDFSVTIADSFIREPAIFTTTTTQNTQVHSYTAGVVRITTVAANGNNTDVDGVTNIFIIGSDDAAEY